MLAVFGNIIVAAMIAVVAGYLAMIRAAKNSPHGGGGPALAFVLVAVPVWLLSAAAILWWGP